MLKNKINQYSKLFLCPICLCDIEDLIPDFTVANLATDCMTCKEELKAILLAAQKCPV